MVHRIFNLSNILGTISFLSIIALVGFTEGGNYIAAVVSGIVFAGFAYLSMREDGTFRKKNRPR